jgi:hypothetical protein
MAKIAQKFKAPVTKKQIFASRDAALQAQFDGKTVYEVAVELDLDTDNVDIIVGQNDVYSLLFIKDDGTEIIIPMSGKLITQFEKEGLDPEDLMALQFRVTDAPVWENVKKGDKIVKVKKVDAEGKEVVAPFLNVGLKGGQFNYERREMMSEKEVENLEGVKED